jgi:hypothetical protein
MKFADPEIRAAYLAGARATFESMCLELAGPACRELEEWIDGDLAGWTGGEPPPPPSQWQPADESDEA